MIGILNVGAGDTKLVFDPADPEGMKRAARIVTDMIRRGFVILVQVGEQMFNGKKEPLYVRAHGFIEGTCEYIIADDQPEEHRGETREDQRREATASAAEPQRRGRPRGSRNRRVSATGRHGVAVGRTAGG